MLRKVEKMTNDLAHYSVARKKHLIQFSWTAPRKINQSGRKFETAQLQEYYYLFTPHALRS